MDLLKRRFRISERISIMLLSSNYEINGIHTAHNKLTCQCYAMQRNGEINEYLCIWNYYCWVGIGRAMLLKKLRQLFHISSFTRTDLMNDTKNNSNNELTSQSSIKQLFRSMISYRDHGESTIVGTSANNLTIQFICCSFICQIFPPLVM